jgi:hypothetical protein
MTIYNLFLTFFLILHPVPSQKGEVRRKDCLCQIRRKGRSGTLEDLCFAFYPGVSSQSYNYPINLQSLNNGIGSLVECLASSRAKLPQDTGHTAPRWLRRNTNYTLTKT